MSADSDLVHRDQVCCETSPNGDFCLPQKTSPQLTFSFWRRHLLPCHCSDVLLIDGSQILSSAPATMSLCQLQSLGCIECWGGVPPVSHLTPTPARPSPSMAQACSPRFDCHLFTLCLSKVSAVSFWVRPSLLFHIHFLP